MKAFTIFTGTYNSESVIERVFRSVENQSVNDFEWVIIDDCSKDATVDMVKRFIETHPDLDIKLFVHTTNTGVAVSRREALMHAKGEYFISWDHDDEQSSTQLETYLQLWRSLDNVKIANIFAKITDQHGKLLGQKFPTVPFISDYISVHNKYLIGNKDAGNVVEHHVCVKTEKFREVLAYYEARPTLLEGRFPNGGDVWGMLAYLGYQTIYTNTPVRVYYLNETGRETMSSTNRKRSADRIFRNKLLWVNYFDTKLPMRETPMKVRNIFATVFYGLLANKSLKEIKNEIHNGASKLLALILFAPAFYLAKKYDR